MENCPPVLPRRRAGCAAVEDTATPTLPPKPKAACVSFFPRESSSEEQSRQATFSHPSPWKSPSPLHNGNSFEDSYVHKTSTSLPQDTSSSYGDAPPLPRRPTEYMHSQISNCTGSSQLLPSSPRPPASSTLPCPPKTVAAKQSPHHRTTLSKHFSLPAVPSVANEAVPPGSNPLPSSAVSKTSTASIGCIGEKDMNMASASRVSASRVSESRVSESRVSESSLGDGGAFSIDNFVTSYAHLLPTRVRVAQGYFDFERNFGVTTGEVYNLHFIKKTKSVSISDTMSQNYTLPLNASVEYSLLHNPDGDLERARAGYTYRTAGDIMALKTLPTVVRTRSAYKGGDSSSSVEEFEVFVILGITKKHRFLRSRILSVYSITNSVKKMLAEECEGNFSTDPYGTKLFLPEILQHILNPFPANALMFVSPDIAHNLPMHLFDELLVLEDLVESKSIIATVCDLHNPSCAENLIEFPVSLPCTVTFLDDSSDGSSLYDCTKIIIDDFDPSKVNTCAISVDPRKGKEKFGIEVEIPLYQSLSGWNLPEVCLDEESGNYQLLTKETFSDGAEGGGEAVHPESQTGAVTDCTIQCETKAAYEMVETHSADSERISALEQQLKEMKRVTAALQSDLCNVQLSTETSLVRVEKQLLDISKQLHKLEWMTGESSDKKFQLVPSSLSVDQVGDLLDCLGLQQYKAIFKQEGINGDILVNLTDEVLQYDLYIHSPHDRNKLLNVIQGKSAFPAFLIPIK